MYRYSTKEKRGQIAITQTINLRLNRWLSLNIEEMSIIFNFSVKTFNTLKVLNLQTMGDILLFPKNGLVKGTGLTTEEFNRLHYKDRGRIRELESDHRKLVNPPKPWVFKITPRSMEEIESMLTKLGLTLKQE